MSNIDKYKAMGAKAAAEGVDMTKAKAGGGDYEAPKAGPCNLRLVGYFEIGKQKGSYLGKPTQKDKVQVVFEVSGKNYPPHVADDGTKTPIRITIEETLSLSEKARFFKLFRVMNYAGKAQHMVELLGDAFKGEIIHRKYAKRGEDKVKPETWTGLAVELFDKNSGSYTIQPPRFEERDEEGEPTGVIKTINVAPMLTKAKAFLWDYSDLDDWNNLFIEGEYPERKNEKGEVIAAAKSKNVLQNAIKLATNFKGSPIYNLIATAGGDLSLPSTGPEDDGESLDDVDAAAAAQTKEVPTGADADDALNQTAGTDALAGVV